MLTCGKLALGCGYVTGSGTVFDNLQTIAVFGTGAVCLVALMAGRISGCTKVIAVDIVFSRLKLAKKLGATETINSKEEDPVEKIKSLTNGYGVDYTVDTTGILAVTHQAIDTLAQDGTCAGIAVTPHTVDVGLSANDKSFVVVLMGDSVPQIELIEFYKLRMFDFDKAEKFYDFEDINQANADSISGKTIKPALIIDKNYKTGD